MRKTLKMYHHTIFLFGRVRIEMSLTKQRPIVFGLDFNHELRVFVFAHTLAFVSLNQTIETMNRTLYDNTASLSIVYPYK